MEVSALPSPRSHRPNTIPQSQYAHGRREGLRRAVEASRAMRSTSLFVIPHPVDANRHRLKLRPDPQRRGSLQARSAGDKTLLEQKLARKAGVAEWVPTYKDKTSSVKSTETKLPLRKFPRGEHPKSDGDADKSPSEDIAREVKVTRDQRDRDSCCSRRITAR